MTPDRPRDRGAASIWVLVCCALLGVVAAFAGIRTEAVLARHRAESGADLAALAAAGQIGVSPNQCAAARRIALSNGVRLTSCRVHLSADTRSGTVLVTVRAEAHLLVVGTREVVASARAGRLPAAETPLKAGAPARDRGG